MSIYLDTVPAMDRQTERPTDRTDITISRSAWICMLTRDTKNYAAFNHGNLAVLAPAEIVSSDNTEDSANFEKQ